MVIEDTINSRGIKRIVKALKDRPSDLDVVVIQVIGRLEHLKAKVAQLDKPYALVQSSVRSTKNPNTKDWLEVWNGAVAVWSFYDLYELCREDGLEPDFNFYHAPLGVDEVFQPTDDGLLYEICTSGTYLTESVRECIKATKGRVAHLGEEVNLPNVDYYTELSDEELARLYGRCLYVSGLRRTEGFELPAAEALCCGVRPILFDKPHYRQWYDGLGQFIPEDSRENVIETLQELFSIPYVPVSTEEIKEARKRFNWDEIIEGFYECIKLHL